MEYTKYPEWLRAQPLSPNWLDEHGTPVREEMKGMFVSIDKALRIKAVVERDLKRSVTLRLDSLLRSTDDKQPWRLDFLDKNDQPLTIAGQTQPGVLVGVVFAEMSMPTGWRDSDGANFYIGVDAPGHLTWDEVLSSDDLPLAWIPDAKPRPVAAVPGTTTTDWSAFNNTSQPIDNGNFTNMDRAKLYALAAVFGVK